MYIDGQPQQQQNFNFEYGNDSSRCLPLSLIDFGARAYMHVLRTICVKAVVVCGVPKEGTSNGAAVSGRIEQLIHHHLTPRQCYIRGVDWCYNHVITMT
jgi:hypothetical protein